MSLRAVRRVGFRSERERMLALITDDAQSTQDGGLASPDGSINTNNDSRVESVRFVESVHRLR
jgi:hypothetical protein